MKKAQRKKIRRFFLNLSVAASLVFAVFFFVQVSFVVAVSPEDQAALDKLKDQNEDKLDALKDKIKTYQKIVTLKEREENALVAEAERLDAQSSALEGTITGNERRLADLGQQIESLESRIGEKEKTIALQKRLLADVLRSYSDSQAQSGTLVPFFLAPSGDVEQLLSGRDHFFEVGSGVRDTLSGIVNLRDSLSRERGLASEKKVEIQSVKLRLEQQNAYLENSKRNKETLAAKAAAEQTKYETVISDLERQRKEIEDEIEQLDAARAGKIDLSTIPGFSSGVLGYPVASPHKSQGYGKTTFTKWYTFHNGVDFSGDVGTPILAAEKGTVIGMGDEGRYAYGKWIAIQHANGLTTLYGHMSKQLVKKGESVDRGEKIGLMGSTGYSTGPHVHFGVYSTSSFEEVKSTSVKGLMIPTGAHINPAKYL